MTTDSVSQLRSLTPERPFPGPYPYREADGREGYFQGRRPEADELLRLIRRNPLTLLFGASGLGKSSLLSAGLFPELRKAGYLPASVRLRYDSPGSSQPALPDLSRQIMAEVRDAARRERLEIEHAENRTTLWDFFHRLEVWSETTTLLTPVVVLDQFEECFTLGAQSSAHRQAVSQLFVALGDLVENRVPQVLGIGRLQGELATFGERPALVRVVLSLREEYLPHLEPLRRNVSALGRSRMRLLPFDGQQAAEVIVASAPLLLSREVAQGIVRTVAGSRLAMRRGGGGPPAAKDGERPLEELTVEPALLNLFCYQLNERRLKTAAAVAPRQVLQDRSKIGFDLVAASGTDILNDFYRECLEGLGRRAREFVERRLLSPSGYRLPVPREDALSEPGIDERTLAALEDRRLIRQETRQDTVYVQLVHDVLAYPIRESRANQRSRRVAWLSWCGVALAVAVALGVSAYFAYQVNTKGDEAYRELNPKLVEARNDYAELRPKLVEVQAAYAALNELTTVQAQLQHAQDDLEQSRRKTYDATQAKEAAEDSMLRARAQAQRARELAQAAEKRRRELENDADVLEKKRVALAHTVELLEATIGIPPKPE